MGAGGSGTTIMKRALLLCLPFFGLLLGATSKAAATDMVQLVNGDRLSGEVVRMDKSELVLKTSYAGEIRVKWDEVACVSTDREFTFVLKSGK
jgi:hypothetical protein